MSAHAAALALTTFVVATIACVPSTEQEEPAVEEVASTETDSEAINDVRERWITTVNAADPNGFLTLVTADVEWMPPDEETITGTEALQSWVENVLAQVTLSDFAATYDEVVVSGDWAFTRGSGSWEVTPIVGGEPTRVSAKNIWIFQRQADGSWKVSSVIWNSNRPPPSEG